MGTGSGQLVNAAFFVQSGGPLLVEKVSAHPPGPRDVVVRMRAAGICHTDATVLAAGALPTPPAILGHEGAGVVEWVGPEVSEFRVGDRVLGLTISRCGRCANCRRGTPYLCETAGPYAEPRAVRSDGTELVTKNGLGTFAETMTVPPVARAINTLAIKMMSESTMLTALTAATPEELIIAVLNRLMRMRKA